MKRTLIALGLAASLAAGAASAQESDMTMQMGLSMLELSVSNEFRRMGRDDVDVMSLTLHQIGQIQNIIRSTNDFSDAERDAQIEKILAN